MMVSALDTWQEALQACTSGPAAPWSQALRQRAAERFAALGWPTARHEAWKYTNVKELMQTPFVLAPPPAGVPAAEEVTPPWGGAHQAVFINGHFAAHLSTLPSQAGVQIQALSAALHDPVASAQHHLGALRLADTQPFAALGQALLQDGLFVHVAAGKHLQAPLELLFLSTGTDNAWMAHPHVVVMAEQGSSVCLIERHEGLGQSAEPCLTNVVTELFVAARASVQHCVLQAQHSGAYHMNTLAAHVAEGAELTAFNLSLGAALARQSLQVQLAGTHARCSLAGLQLGRATQHHAMQVVVEHASTHTQSAQLFKGVFDAQATGVFSGKVLVQPGAIKTDARQLNKNLLLSRQAMAHALPQLEILADDVKCSHGATVGQLDEDARFYLRSRGLDATTTQRLLTFAFASDVLGSIPHNAVRAALDAQVRNWLQLSEESTGVA